MGLKNCPECGKLFLENMSGICPECYREEEKEELKVIEFLHEKGKSSIEEIHQATGVKERTIFRMLKRGSFVGIAGVSYKCENCGRPIYDGRLCSKCNKEFMKQVHAMQQTLVRKPRDLEPSDEERRLYMRRMKEF